VLLWELTTFRPPLIDADYSSDVASNVSSVASLNVTDSNQDESATPPAAGGASDEPVPGQSKSAFPNSPLILHNPLLDAAPAGSALAATGVTASGPLLVVAATSVAPNGSTVAALPGSSAVSAPVNVPGASAASTATSSVASTPVLSPSLASPAMSSSAAVAPPPTTSAVVGIPIGTNVPMIAPVANTGSANSKTAGRARSSTRKSSQHSRADMERSKRQKQRDAERRQLRERELQLEMEEREERERDRLIALQQSAAAAMALAATAPGVDADSKQPLLTPEEKKRANASSNSSTVVDVPAVTKFSPEVRREAFAKKRQAGQAGSAWAKQHKWVAEDNRRLPIPRNCPVELSRIIERCWHQQPTRRPTFTEIVSMLDDLEQRDLLSLRPLCFPFRRF